MTIVADSGPILSFARANRLELLHQVIGGLTIPDAVYEEIVIRGAGKPRSTEVQGANLANISCTPVRNEADCIRWFPSCRPVRARRKL
jgi:predicted nucleic acid-binding protein